jgi:hypothetical protein
MNLGGNAVLQKPAFRIPLLLASLSDRAKIARWWFDSIFREATRSSV